MAYFCALECGFVGNPVISAAHAGSLASPHALSLMRRVAVAKLSSRHPSFFTVFTPTDHVLSDVANRSGVFAWGVGPRFRPLPPFRTHMLHVPGLGPACLACFPAVRTFSVASKNITQMVASQPPTGYSFHIPYSKELIWMGLPSGAGGCRSRRSR